ncbi:MAG: hypothetical protein WBA93_34785 [Microcoleaceae cyanobacterium]
MLAFIGGLFAGVFGILGNLLGKKSDYLLEFDDAKGTDAPKQEPAKTEGAPKAAKTEAKPATETAKAAKAAKKSQRAKLEEPAPPKVAAPQPPVTNVNISQKPEEVVLFAPNFLMPKPTAKRRRPGPSMSMFRSMAQDMNLRK